MSLLQSQSGVCVVLRGIGDAPPSACFNRHDVIPRRCLVFAIVRRRRRSYNRKMIKGLPSEPAAPRKGSGSRRKIANSLIALSSAAVFAVYTAGYLRTRSTAHRLAAAAAQRRTVAPLVARATVSTVVSSLPSVAAIPSVAVAPAPKSAARVRPRRTASPRPAPTAAAVSPGAPAPVPVTVPTEASTALPPATATTTPQGHYKDGTYLGWGSSSHGEIQASVVVEGGLIASVAIARCRTNYSCSFLDALPQQVVIRQSAHVDFLSGATESVYAFSDAVAQALSRAR